MPAEVSKPQSVPASTRRGIADGRGHPLDPLGHDLGVLDEVGERVDHARDQDLVVVQNAAFEAAILVRVARVGEREHEAADLRLPDDRQDVGERHVLVVRALVVAPAHVHAHALARDVRRAPG